ncbi:MAG TPA: OsmC family protein [Gaiellaceae bacterium]|nr:OsmC family protein [Gaiellaceae bacterium]
MRSTPKEFRYAIELDADGGLHTENGTGLVTAPAWTPEHLLLAGLVRCSLDSLRHHAKRAEVEVTGASAGASARVTRRESDGRYAVVEASVELAVRLDPEPGPDALAELLAKAERDCFVGASLTAKPTYRWRVND